MYLLLLGLSWFVQIKFSYPEISGKYQNSETIQIDEHPTEFTFHELGSEKVRSKSTLIIIPDVYYQYDAILPIAEKLSENYHVIIPELNSLQNGTNSDRLTIESKADILDQFIAHLQIDEFHLAGNGYGGLVAVDAAIQSGGRVKSLVLIGSLGVQELRFLGNHHINRSLYSLSRPFLNLYKYTFPHFGRYHQQKFSLDYVDAMRNLDQRDFRDDVKKLDQPVLIVHAENDQNVPLSTAKETFRLIPQSKLIFFEGDQNNNLLNHNRWSTEINLFLDNAENQRAITKNSAHEERIKQAEEPFNAEDVEALQGKALIVIILLIMSFTIFSEDLSVIAAGLLTAAGILPFFYAVLSCFLGILILDTNIYWLGKKVGNPALKKIPFKWLIKEDDLNRAQNLYEMYGMELLFVARFIPGARFPMYFAAGLLKSSFKKFFIYFFISIAVWTPLLVGITVLIGQPMIQYLSVYQDYAFWILLFTVLIIYLIVKVGIPMTTVRGRRRLLVKWSRFWQKWGR
jgi:membrane protein DedA with SNARE-associated domain